MPQPLPPDALQDLRKGKRIEAIKRVREANRSGSEEARELVDAADAGAASDPRTAAAWMFLRGSWRAARARTTRLATRHQRE